MNQPIPYKTHNVSSNLANKINENINKRTPPHNKPNHDHFKISIKIEEIFSNRQRNS